VEQNHKEFPSPAARGTVRGRKTPRAERAGNCKLHRQRQGVKCLPHEHFRKYADLVCGEDSKRSDSDRGVKRVSRDMTRGFGEFEKCKEDRHEETKSLTRLRLVRCASSWQSLRFGVGSLRIHHRMTRCPGGDADHSRPARPPFSLESSSTLHSWWRDRHAA